jgi:hypothetical protein
MLAVIVGACTWAVFGVSRSQLPQDPGGPVYSVLGALGPYGGDDLAQAREVMAGDKIPEMLRRLRTIRQQLMTVKANYELITELPQVKQNGDTATVSAEIYDLVQQGTGGETVRSDSYEWRFNTVHEGFPESGWFMTEFTAPDICLSYADCSPGPAPAPSSSRPPYAPVYLSCAPVDASGVADKVVTYMITLDADGTPDFTPAWHSNNVSCTVDPLHPQPVASSPVERAAVQASQTGGEARSGSCMQTAPNASSSLGWPTQTVG